MVTSDDWITYPTIGMDLVPDMIDVLIINRPNLPAAGAGEHAARVVAASLANAFFDATGVRMRRIPLTPERVMAVI
jgi:CO/xanthine dehydrogenase Mo-binding subunit